MPACKDDFSRLQAGFDHLGVELGAADDEQEQFREGKDLRVLVRKEDLAHALPDRRPPRFAGGNHVAILLLEAFRQKAGLSGLAGEVDPFKHDQLTREIDGDHLQRACK